MLECKSTFKQFFVALLLMVFAICKTDVAEAALLIRVDNVLLDGFNSSKFPVNQETVIGYIDRNSIFGDSYTFSYIPSGSAAYFYTSSANTKKGTITVNIRKDSASGTILATTSISISSSSSTAFYVPLPYVSIPSDTSRIVFTAKHDLRAYYIDGSYDVDLAATNYSSYWLFTVYGKDVIATEINDVANAAAINAQNAYNAANTAATNAQNAYNAANTAASAAQVAQSAANTAATNAQNAYNAANNAYNAASTAATNAQNAYNAANTAANQTIYNGQSAAYWAYQAAQGGTDTTPPTIQKVAGQNGATCTSTGTFYVVVQATDNRTGQLQARAQVDGGTWTGWYNVPQNAIPVTLSSVGAHTITVEVKDAAGNSSQATMTAFRV
ncbi:hypothetical protein MOOR_16290 [Moorella thermoacetica]|uniref:Bacterial Ig-like domain-containing protein n=1 Tax=Neomoorella thermoacetica TaxID=1525 RepID=A0A1J5JGP1_NEOTH|nr:hypothetical protein [Moorella thermoacetica]OIQ08710.1 hypothetical protein MOOR_16290 [Moorella thermoacetica]